MVYLHLQIISKECPYLTWVLLALVQKLLYAIKLQKIRVGDCIRLVLNSILLSCFVEKNPDMLHCSVRSERQQSENYSVDRRKKPRIEKSREESENNGIGKY